MKLKTIDDLVIALKSREDTLNKQIGIKANKARVDKYKAINDQLELFWRENISPTLGNNQAAKALMDTEIYKQSKAKPEKATIAGHVGDWKKNSADLRRKSSVYTVNLFYT
jgi:hypothetical protein